jgi:hypothetical protein
MSIPQIIIFVIENSWDFIAGTDITRLAYSGIEAVFLFSPSFFRYNPACKGIYFGTDYRMRILTLCYEYPPIGGGGAKVVAGLTKILAEQGNKVDLVTMSFQNLPRFQQLDGVDIYRVPCLRTKASICHPHEMASYILMAQPLLLKLARQAGYDINHTHFISRMACWLIGLKSRPGFPMSLPLTVQTSLVIIPTALNYCMCL